MTFDRLPSPVPSRALCSLPSLPPPLPPSQIIDACDRFNGRNPVKGMPPGIFSEDDGAGHSSLTKTGAVLLAAVATLMAFAAVKVVKTRGVGGLRRRGWQVVSEAEAASISQVRFLETASQRQVTYHCKRKNAHTIMCCEARCLSGMIMCCEAFFF